MNRSKRLADHGSEFAKWITEDHLKELNEIGGTTQARTLLVNKVNKFLEDSYEDMPVDPIYTERLGYSYSQLAANIGGIRQNTIGDLEQAATSYERAIELYDKTLETTQDAGGVLRLKADALIELSDVQLGLGQANSKTLSEARSIIDSMEASPDVTMLQIRVAGRLIDSAMANNKHKDALSMLKDLDGQISQLESIERYRVEWVNQRILSASKKGLCEENLGNVDQAKTHLSESVRLAREAYEKDTDNVKEKKRLATTINRLGDLLFWEEKYDEAKPLYEESLGISESLAKKDANSVDAKIDFAVKLSHIAGLYQNMNLLDKAESSNSQVIKIYEKLIEDGSKDRRVLEGLVINVQSLATVYALKQDYDKSQECFDRHYSICKAEFEKDETNVFVLNQLAENRITQSLKILGSWASQEHDPESVDDSPQLKMIDEYLNESLDYFERTKAIIPLNAKQQSQIEQISKIKSVIKDAVQQIKASANDNDSNQPKDPID